MTLKEQVEFALERRLHFDKSVLLEHLVGIGKSQGQKWYCKTELHSEFVAQFLVQWTIVPLGRNWGYRVKFSCSRGYISKNYKMNIKPWWGACLCCSNSQQSNKYSTCQEIHCSSNNLKTASSDLWQDTAHYETIRQQKAEKNASKDSDLYSKEVNRTYTRLTHKPPMKPDLTTKYSCGDACKVCWAFVILLRWSQTDVPICGGTPR